MQLINISRHSVKKNYSLAMVEGDNLTPQFDINNCPNKWTVDSKVIQEANRNFLDNQEEVTMIVSRDHFKIKNYNDSIDEKKTINTDFSMQPVEFELFRISEDTRVTFCMKEFRSFMLFAEYLNVPIRANFSVGGSPLILTMSQGDFLTTTYVLATLAEDGSSQPTVRTPEPVRQQSRTPSSSLAPVIHHSTQQCSNVPAPSQMINNSGDLSTIPPDSLLHDNFQQSLEAGDVDEVAASPPQKKKNFLFRRCFDTTWNPREVVGTGTVLAPDSDEEN